MDTYKIIDIALILFIIILTYKILSKLNDVAINYRRELQLQHKKIKQSLLTRISSTLIMSLFIIACSFGLYYLFKWSMILFNTEPPIRLSEMMYLVLFMLSRIGGLLLMVVFIIGVFLYILIVIATVDAYIIRPTAIDIEESQDDKADDEWKEI